MKLAARRTPRLSRRAAATGIVALALGVAGALVDRPAFFQSWLVSWLFVLGIALGSLVLLMIHELTGGDWGTVVGPQLDAAALTLPLVALLGLPLAFALDLFPWTHADVVELSATVAAKHWYLNVPAFLARNAVSLVLWCALALIICRPARVPRRAAAAGLLFYFVTVTLFAVDWVASLVPEWYSSAVGIQLGALQIVSAFAFVVLVTVLRGKSAATPLQLQDLGNLLLTFAMTWAYFAFAQYLVVWGGDLPHETSWYWPRTQTSWRYLGIAIICLVFALPVVAMLFRAVKRSATAMAIVCSLVLFGAWCCTFWLIVPSLRPAGFALQWQDLAMLLGLGGLWLAVVAIVARRGPRRAPAIGASTHA